MRCIRRGCVEMDVVGYPEIVAVCLSSDVNLDI